MIENRAGLLPGYYHFGRSINWLKLFLLLRPISKCRSRARFTVYGRSNKGWTRAVLSVSRREKSPKSLAAKQEITKTYRAESIKIYLFVVALEVKYMLLHRLAPELWRNYRSIGIVPRWCVRKVSIFFPLSGGRFCVSLSSIANVITRLGLIMKLKFSFNRQFFLHIFAIFIDDIIRVLWYFECRAHAGSLRSIRESSRAEPKWVSGWLSMQLPIDFSSTCPDIESHQSLSRGKKAFIDPHTNAAQ